MHKHIPYWEIRTILGWGSNWENVILMNGRWGILWVVQERNCAKAEKSAQNVEHVYKKSAFPKLKILCTIPNVEPFFKSNRAAEKEKSFLHKL